MRLSQQSFFILRFKTTKSHMSLGETLNKRMKAGGNLYQRDLFRDVDVNLQSESKKVRNKE